MSAWPFLSSWPLLCTLQIPARPAGLWTLVDFIEGPAVLKITAKPGETWAYSDSLSAVCGADGDPHSLLSASKCLVPKAPVGALVGKIGGSTAGAETDTSFVVGSACIVKIADEGGALFLTINDESGGMDNNADGITVEIHQRPARSSGTLPQPQPDPASPTPTPPAPVADGGTKP
jgi:hypothetical protein